MANSSDSIQGDLDQTGDSTASGYDQTGRVHGSSQVSPSGDIYGGASQASSTGQAYAGGSQPSFGAQSYQDQASFAGRSYGGGQASFGGPSYQSREVRLTNQSYRGGQSSTSGGGIVEQIRNQPLVALGLSLVAGSLLQQYLSGGQSSTPRYQSTGGTSYGGYGTTQRGGTYYGQTQGGVRQSVGNAAQTVGDAAQSAGQTAAGAASTVVDTARDAAFTAADTARDAASTVVDTARDAASTAVDTTVDVAQRVADTAGDVAYRVADTAGDVTGEVTERVGDLASTVSTFVSERPVLALGISLAAGSLLQQYLSGGQGSSRTTSTSRSAYAGYRPSYPDYGVDYGTVAGSDAYMRSTGTVSGTARSAASSVGDAAQSVGQTASNAASSVVDTTRDAASSVADTASDVAQRAGSMVANAADQVVDTAGSAAGQVADTVSDIWPAVTRQVQERPLTTLGLAVGTGMLLQPTLAPHISAVTSDVRDAWSTVSSNVGQVVSLPEPPEAQRIREAVVPATVNRTRQLVNRDLRDYLDRSLEGLVSQGSLRAGVVAAITERAEALVDRRFPKLLNGLSGTPGLLVLGLVGAVLQARNQAQQGQGQTMSNVRTQLSQSIVQNAQEQLSRYFPEFRQQFQSQQSQQSQQSTTERCSNCGTPLAPNARFCTSCGTPVSAGTSV